MRTWILVGTLLLALLAAGPGSRALAEERYALSESEVRDLVAKAASVDGRFFRTLGALGAKVTVEDLLNPEVDVPLTVVVLVVPHRELDPEDFALFPGATPKSVSAALAPEGEGAGRASLLRAEYVQEVTVQVNGRTATGTVSFRAPGAYEGTLTYTAFHDDAGWKVLELAFPRSKVRSVLEDGRWRLRMPRAGAGGASARRADLDLPRVGTVGVATSPEGTTAVISVTRDGWIRVPGESKPLSLMELQRWLQRKTANPVLREPDGSSRVDALLDVDSTIPWTITQWIMQTCANPEIRIYRISLGAQTRDGKAGAIATVLPKDRGLEPTRRTAVDIIKHKVKLFKLERATEPSDMRALYTQLKARHEATGRSDDTVFEIVAPPPKGGLVPHGYVVQAVDVCLAVGAHNIVFEGAAYPRGDALLASADWLKRHIDTLRETPGVPVIKLNNDPSWIAGAAEGLGAVPARGLLAQRWGAGVSMMAEQVETLEEVVEEAPAPVEEGLSDAPFEGPANNGSIGIGGGAAGAFRGRGGGPPAAVAPQDAEEREGRAVDDGLRWLAAHQAPNGGWPAAAFGDFCDGKPVSQVDKIPDGRGKPLYDPGVTGLALQAFLGAGYTNRGQHPFAKVVSRGLRYLKNIQDPEGCFGPRSTQQYIYNHAMGALAMVEAYGMTGSPIFKGSAQRALDFIGLARNPYFAWRYGIKPGDNDTSVTGWMLAALYAARMINEDAIRNGKPAPLTIDETAFDGAKAWLDKVTDPKHGAVGYVQRGTGPARPQELVDRFPAAKSESMTAVAVLARIRMGEDPRRSANVQNGLARIAKKPPVWNPADGSVDMYYWHWGALAMYQAGDKAFTPWRTAMLKAIVDSQRKDTDYCGYKGSWDPIGPWGPDGGRVYSTAMLTLSLQARYRYDRVFGK